MNSRRLYAPVVLATLGAGGLALLGASRVWSRATVSAGGLPPDRVGVTGAAAQPLIPALAVVAVTAALAVLAASPRVRRFVGVFTLAVGVLGLGLVLVSGSAVQEAVGRAVESSQAYVGTNRPVSHDTLWPVVSAVGFAVVALLGAITTRFGPGWPTMGSRYDAPRSHAPKAEPATDAEIWKALDEGRDPTQ